MAGALERLWAKIRDAFVSERAIAWGAIYEQVWAAVDADPMLGPLWPWINDMYQEDEQTVALVSAGGKLYRVPVMVSGTDVSIGTPQEVEVTFTPRARTFAIMRQADGTHRWFAITETAVLLRVGEIDSRALFDSFIQHAEETGEYPKLRFYHDARLDFGQADWLAREDNCYLASGTLDEEHPLARAFIDASESGRGVWGTSNGFDPTAEPERMRVAEDVTIPVYTAGIHREISVLPEADAASWFTAIQARGYSGEARGVTRMRDKVKEALETLFGDADAAAAFIAQVDNTNREITEHGLVTRDSAQGTEGEAGEGANAAGATTKEQDEDNPENGADTEPEQGEPREIVLDEATLVAIAERVPIPPVNLEPVTLEIAAVRGTMREVLQRLEALERDDDAKRAQWQADLPARGKVVVTHRPREARKAEAPDGKPDYAAIAASTVEHLPG